jgi:hypothetical protein
MEKKNTTARDTIIALSVIPAIGFAVFMLKDHGEPTPAHSGGAISQAIEQSERIRNNAEPATIREVREPSGFSFELAVDGTLTSEKMPGLKVSKFSLPVHSKEECLRVSGTLARELPNVSTIILNDQRASTSQWLGSIGEPYCAFAFQEKGKAELTIEYP